MAKPNTVQRTLLEQLQIQNPFFMTEFHVKGLVLMTKNRIRLCSRGRRKINIDITYNSGTDLYDVKAYLLLNYGLDLTTIYDQTDLFWDQLNTVLKTILEQTQTLKVKK